MPFERRERGCTAREDTRIAILRGDDLKPPTRLHAVVLYKEKIDAGRGKIRELVSEPCHANWVPGMVRDRQGPRPWRRRFIELPNIS